MSLDLSRFPVRRVLVVFAVLVGLVTTSIMIVASIWPTINRVETGRTIEYPHLLPRVFQLDYARIYEEALSAAREQQAWTLTGEDQSTGVITATTTMPVTGWNHTVTIQVIKRSEFVSRIHVISENTDAPGDLGHNARLIEGYYKALDRRLGAADVTQKAIAPES